MVCTTALHFDQMAIPHGTSAWFQPLAVHAKQPATMSQVETGQRDDECHRTLCP